MDVQLTNPKLVGPGFEATLPHNKRSSSRFLNFSCGGTCFVSLYITEQTREITAKLTDVCPIACLCLLIAGNLELQHSHFVNDEHHLIDLNYEANSKFNMTLPYVPLDGVINQKYLCTGTLTQHFWNRTAPLNTTINSV